MMDSILDELCKEHGIIIKATDGLLLIVCDDAGRMHPHVLKLGLLTEGRLEAAIMPIYNEVVKARVHAYNEHDRKAREIRQKIAEAKNATPV